MSDSLTKKYNVPGPRYTSYPTVPYWENDLDVAPWEKTFTVSYLKNKNEGLSIYIHLPFCESMCTFLYTGCPEGIGFVLPAFKEKPLIREIQLGGGTPTFFSPKKLKSLIDGLFSKSRKAMDCEMGFEKASQTNLFSMTV